MVEVKGQETLMGQAKKNLNNGPRKPTQAKPETRLRHKIMPKHNVTLSYVFEFLLTENDSALCRFKILLGGIEVYPLLITTGPESLN